MEILMLLVVCVVVIWATKLVRTGELKPEQFFAVMACLATIAESLRRFG